MQQEIRLASGWGAVGKAAMVAALALALCNTPSFADGGVTFTNITANDGAGVTYRRAPSPRGDERQQILDQSPIPIPNFGQFRTGYAMKGRGVPGIALIDYDNDGDLDIYVTNGPGTPNSLYSNQIIETGMMNFVDVAATAGVTATAQDSSAVCAGDIDNDGDTDIYVAATGEAFILYENNGDGTFANITATAGVAGDGRHANGCTMLDADNDGYLDIVVGNSWDDWTHRMASTVTGPHYAGMEHNYLFMNNGNNTFADMSNPGGLEDVSNMDTNPAGTGAALTWAIGSADLDLDGDTDIICADNQGAAATTPEERRGWNRIFQNNGSGTFDDVTEAAGLQVDGGWMGLAFADSNCDGYMDFFSTNLGDYAAGAGARSVLYQGSADGSYTAFGALEPNSFGWGTSAFDYDNDGDSDFVYHGSVDILSLIFGDNPGVLLQNRNLCTGKLDIVPPDQIYDTNHTLRNVQGVATGDLNNDGFVDIVSASNFNIVPDNNWLPFILATGGPLGSPIDSVARFEVVLTSRVMPGNLVATNPDLELPDGDLAVEINSANNGNNWLIIDPVGTHGLVSNGASNRDAVGAVIELRPIGKPRSMHPIVAGSSYASQDSLDAEFGLGSSRRGHATITWPGGVKNRHYNLAASQKHTIYEVPCDFTDLDAGLAGFLDCMVRSTDEMVDTGLLNRGQRVRYIVSGVRAYNSEFLAANGSGVAPVVLESALTEAGLADLIGQLEN